MNEKGLTAYKRNTHQLSWLNPTAGQLVAQATVARDRGAGQFIAKGTGFVRANIMNRNSGRRLETKSAHTGKLGRPVFCREAYLRLGLRAVLENWVGNDRLVVQVTR